jgi:hypothetical protein
VALDSLHYSKSIWINQEKSTFTSSCYHQAEFYWNVKGGDVSVPFIFSEFVGCFPVLLEAKSIEILDFAFKSRANKTNVSNVFNAGYFLVISDLAYLLTFLLFFFLHHLILHQSYIHWLLSILQNVILLVHTTDLFKEFQILITHRFTL